MKTILLIVLSAGLMAVLTGQDEKGQSMDPKTTTEAQWKEKLTPEQYRVLRQKGTERAFTGIYDEFFEPGTYVCAACGAELFDSDTKYNSGCGWPAFYNFLDGAIEEHPDNSFGMVRTEVACARCGGHLGHVFNDGPPPTGLRYCINSTSLLFQASKKTTD